MSLDSKVIWSEGMFLNPQHFQQQDRYFERYINSKCSAYGAHGWGLHNFTIDEQLLKLGKISLIDGSGVFPDGTPFNLPEVDDPPPVLEVPDNTHNAIVYLGIPVKRPGAIEVLPESNTQGLARYYLSEQRTRDVSDDDGEILPISVGKLRCRLLLEGDDLSGYAVIGLLRIRESREDRDVLLDDQYIPTCLGCQHSLKLKGFLNELVGLLRHRGESIAGRLADTRQGGTAEIADYMLLQLVNRLEPAASHMAATNGLHPLQLHFELVKMAGELATFFASDKRPTELPGYLHEDLQSTFIPLMTALRKGLSMVYEQTAISLDLVEKRFGIRVAEITDPSLLDSALFVLAVKADVTDEAIRKLLPAQIKIGPVERIRQLVNAALPGIIIKPLPVAPRQVPFRAGHTYFELDKHSEFWKELGRSGGFAMHLAGDFPGIEMEFWAIRQ